MKSTWRDFVAAGIFITLLVASSIGVVWIASPLAARWLGDYHVLFDAALAFVSYGLLSAMALRVLLWLKPIPAGDYALDSPEFGRWMLFTAIYRMGQGALSWCTPFYMQHVVDGLFGAKVGRDVAFGGCIDDPYRISVGDEVVLGKTSLLTGNFVSKDRLVCGPVQIGNRVTIGANCIVMPNTVIGDGAVLMTGSCLMPRAVIPPGETWRGNPARKWVGAAESSAPAQ